MKNKYALILLIVFLFSCKHKSIIDEKISEYISKNAHNPESYEPISTMPIDTVTEVERLTSEIKSKLSSLESDSSSVERNKRLLKIDSGDVVLHQEITARHLKENGALYKQLDSLELASSISNLEGIQKDLLLSQEAMQKSTHELKMLEVQLDSVKKAADPNAISRYHFIHQCRAKVPLGGMMLKNIFIETDKDLNIIAFDEQ